MKILNKQKTHYVRISKCGLYQIKYDTVENVNLIINKILNNRRIKNNNLHNLSVIKGEPR